MNVGVVVLRPGLVELSEGDEVVGRADPGLDGDGAELLRGLIELGLVLELSEREITTRVVPVHLGRPSTLALNESS